MKARFLSCALIALLAAAGPTLADDAAEIRARLEGWARDFNEGRIEEACGLFSKELVSDMPGQPEAGYGERCAALARAIKDKDRRFRYAPDIMEVIVSGDLAVVRLTWTLTVTPGGLVSRESGLDVFRKEADGVWRIIRFMSFDQPDE